MAINWKLRLQNRETLTALASLTIGYVYQALAQLGVVPAISESVVVNAAVFVISVLVTVGVVVDPTTKGVSDSERAMDYLEPYDEAKHMAEEVE